MTKYSILICLAVFMFGNSAFILDPDNPPGTGESQPSFTSEISSQQSTGQIVFVKCSDVIAGTGCAIYIMNDDGSQMRQLTNADGDISPSLSPDGKQVVFRSRLRDNDDEIYSINTDGSNLIRLTDHKGSDESPVWTADGKQIAFLSNLNSPDPDNLFMFTMDQDGSNVHRLSQDKVFSPTWSPDGKEIAFVNYKSKEVEIKTMDASGKNAKRISTLKVDSVESLAWSPDGRNIAFFSQVGVIGPIIINIIDRDGGNLHTLAEGYMPIFGGLSWSPDGKKLLFTMRGDGKTLNGPCQLYMINADGSGLQKFPGDCPYCYDADWGKSPQ
jgi:TolB protein